MTSKTKRGMFVALSAGAVLAVSACSGGATPAPGGSTAGGGTGGGATDCAAYESYGDLSGKTITVYTSIASDAEAKPHIDAFIPFEECTGAKVEYEGSREFEAQLPVRVKAGNAPDLAYIPQRQDHDVHFPNTVGELVLAGRRRFGHWWQRPSSHDREVAAASLERVNLAGACDKALSELSGGQLQRAYVARALAQEASVVLLDEALAGVDLPSTRELVNVFEQLASEGTTVLVATHDLALARRRFRRCLAINGTLRADGVPSEVLSLEVLDGVFGSTTADEVDDEELA